MVNALELLDGYIAELEAKLNLQAGEAIPADLLAASAGALQATATKKEGKKKEKKAANNNQKKQAQEPNLDQPEICKLEFKVGQIVKVWVHPNADKLYCEEIDVGEEAPREIASGLRPHFSEEQMLGQRLLVMSNLKAKNLVGFKSHGMVLCAKTSTDDGGEKVEFVEPPADAPIGEMIHFEGLPAPEPLSSAQVEKKKVFQTAAPGLKSNDECIATWNGHKFMTSKGPCKAKTIANAEPPDVALTGRCLPVKTNSTCRSNVSKLRWGCTAWNVCPNSVASCNKADACCQAERIMDLTNGSNTRAYSPEISRAIKADGGGGGLRAL
eukprot:scaffold2290_cov170-Amphora_coffeaeformis.AAC.25